MKNTKLIPLESTKGTMLVEVETAHDGGISAATAKTDQAIDASVEGAVARISGIASSFANLGLPREVEKAVIEMGFQFDTKGSIYLVSSSATASIKLSITLNFHA